MEAEELDVRAAVGETEVEGGIVGKSLQAHKNLAKDPGSHPTGDPSQAPKQ